MHSYREKSIDDIRKQVGNERVVCGLSGGVDSAVTAALIHKAIGNHLSCIFVDNGLLRNYEADEVITTFKDTFTVDLHAIDARDRFLDKLKDGRSLDTNLLRFSRKRQRRYPRQNSWHRALFIPMSLKASPPTEAQQSLSRVITTWVDSRQSWDLNW